jgi:hypothetical protein
MMNEASESSVAKDGDIDSARAFSYCPTGKHVGITLATEKAR